MGEIIDADDQEADASALRFGLGHGAQKFAEETRAGHFSCEPVDRGQLPELFLAQIALGDEADHALGARGPAVGADEPVAEDLFIQSGRNGIRY